MMLNVDISRVWSAVLTFCLSVILVDNRSSATRPGVSLTKICKGAEIEILSRHGVKIEPYDKSRVELLLANPNILGVKGKFKLEFEFNTREPNGTLFYGRSSEHPTELIALSLEKGYLVYKIQCPTLHADILLASQSIDRLDDGQWHKVSYSVTYRRGGQKAHITIDGVSDIKRYEVSCTPMTSIVMGGHSPKDHEYVHALRNYPGHFDGCIRNVRIPTALRSPPKYFVVSVCDQN